MSTQNQQKIDDDQREQNRISNLKQQKIDDEKKEYYQTFYTQHENHIELHVDEFTNMTYHPRDEKFAEYIKTHQGKSISAKAGEPSRVPRYNKFISSISIEGNPTKCEVLSNNALVFDFDLTPDRKVYPLFIVPMWCYSSNIQLKFDADVTFTYTLEYFPHSISHAHYKYPAVTFQHSSWQKYANMMWGKYMIEFFVVEVCK